MILKKTIAGLLAISVAGSAYSFKVNFNGLKPGQAIHENITEAALAGINVVLADGRIASFSDETIKGIQEENTENDEKGLEYGFMHFDDSRINESSSYVWNATNAAITGFINSANGIGQYTWDGRSVITNLGTAAHTTQDFFAHSTWVETNVKLIAYDDAGWEQGGFVRTNRKQYIPVPLLGIVEKPFHSNEFTRYGAGVRVFDDEGGKTGSATSETGGCRPRDAISLKSPEYDASVFQISSAYYDYRMSNIPPDNFSEDAIGRSTSDWNTKRASKLSFQLFPSIQPKRELTENLINWPTDFCTHGDNGPGINKDHEGRPGHLKAHDAAMQATRALALHFLNESGATSSTSISRACSSDANALLKCVGTGTGSLDAYKISSIKAVFPNIATDDFKPTFKFSINEKLVNQGLLSVTFDGEACHIYDDDSQTTTKSFFCDSDKKGAGKLRIAQRALSAIPLYESTTFAITCENGLSSVDGACGNIVSDTVAPFFVQIGQTISLWLNSTLESIKTVVWNFGADVAEKTVAFSSLLGISDKISQSFNSLGTKTITATFKGILDTVLGQSTTTITVTAVPLPIATATITTVTSDTTTQPGAIANSGSTDDTTPTLIGTISTALTDGQRVNVYDGASVFYALAVVNGTNWSFTPATPLIGGSHSFTAAVATFDGTEGARSSAFVVNVLSTSVASIAPGEIIRTLVGSFDVTGRDLPTSGLTVTVPGDAKASCQTPNNMTATGFNVACTFYQRGAQALEIRSGGQVLSTVSVLVKTNVTGVTWTAPSTTNSGTVMFGETVTFKVAGVNLLADTTMGFAVEKCGVSNTEVSTPSNTERSFTCNFNNYAGAVAGQMPGVVKDAPDGQVLFDGWNVPVEVGPSTGSNGRLPDTGITASQCYAAGSNAFVDCTSVAAIALNDQQDGMVGRDVTTPDNSNGKLGFDYIKLDVNGGTLSANATAWSCVKDNITGLTWEVKTADGGLRDMNNTYTNYGDGRDGDTSSFITAVNLAKPCGYSDWRLPTVDELQGIVDYSAPNPSIESTWFVNTMTFNFIDYGAYWTSTQVTASPARTWFVGFNGGGVYNENSYFPYYVRLVR